MQTQPIWIILFCFLGIQFFLIQTTYLTPDEALYAWKTAHLKEDPLTIFNPVLWESHPPFIPAIASLFPVDAVSGLRLLSIISGALALWLVHRIIRRISNKEHANATVLILTFSTTFLYYSHFGLLDVPLMASILLLIDGILDYWEKGGGKKMASSLILGALIKTKGLAITLPIVVLAGTVKKLKQYSIRIQLFSAINLILIFDILVMIFAFASGKFKYYITSFPFENTSAFLSLIPVWGVGLTAIGIYHLRNDKKVVIPLLMVLWGINTVLFISWPNDAKRFFLFALPFIIFFTVEGIDWVSHFFNSRFNISHSLVRFAILISLIFPGAIWGIGGLYVSTDGNGMQSAMDWVDGKEGLFFSGFKNEMRYYSFAPLSDDGLRLYPYTDIKFMEYVKSSDTTVYALTGTLSSPFFGTYITDTFLTMNSFRLEHEEGYTNRFSGKYKWRWYIYEPEKEEDGGNENESQ